MKKLSELNISPAPWSAGINPYMATILDGYEGKCIYADGDVNNTPYVGFANVVNGDTASAIRNAKLLAAAPDMYKTEYDLIDVIERLLNGLAGTCDTPSQDEVVAKIEAAKEALAKAAGEEESKSSSVG